MTDEERTIDNIEITAEELAENADKCVIFDMRSEHDRAYGLIPGSRHAAEDELYAMKSDERTSGKKIVVYCAHGEFSLNPVESMRESGLDAYSLRGGYAAWLRLAMAKQAADDGVCERVEQSIRKKFRVSLMSPFIRALKEYKLVGDGDRVAVCISGGKDSMLMAKLFQELHRYSDVNFDLKFLVMDPGYNAENRRVIEENARRLNVPIEIFESNIFESVYTVEKSPCYLCARMRRGYLYSFAKRLDCNKIALGHHYDDVIETILMGMLYGAQIQTMMPKLRSTNFEGMELIRPMYFIREDDIKAWRDYNDLHFIQCACRFTDTCTTCNNGQNHSKRQEAKELIRTLKKTNPNVEKCIFKSVENVSLETILAYKKNGVKHFFLDDYDERKRLPEETE